MFKNCNEAQPINLSYYFPRIVMNIALLGANGQLGQDLLRALSMHEVKPLTRSHVDVTDHTKVQTVLIELRPDVIINTTAFHRVDDCESQPDTAFRVNADAVGNLASVANKLDSTIVHFSTDYVFDGKSNVPYTEDSEPRPLSVYAKSKLAGEKNIQSEARKYFLVRTCGLYGKVGTSSKAGRNFVETMLAKARRGEKLQVVADQQVSPTYTHDLANQIAVLISTPHFGLFHATNEGVCSWFEFAKAIFELNKLNVNLSPTTSDIYKTPAIRPRYSVLENAKLKKLGLNQMRHWRDALAAYLND